MYSRIIFRFGRFLNLELQRHSTLNIQIVASGYRNSSAVTRSTSLYSNKYVSRRILLLGGDISVNPGPRTSPVCSSCGKAARVNQKRVICETCKDISHAKCMLSNFNYIKASQPQEWTCNKCIMSVLPFFGHDTNTLNTSNISIDDFSTDHEDQHLNNINTRKSNLSLLHLNTQSMASTFNELLLTVQKYEFDIATLSETWLKDNHLLLSHVSIPGYTQEFRNRDTIKGGGVGAYIKNNIKYRRRKDIENKHPELEHLWIEIQGKNKNSSMLLGTIYRSTRIIETQQWFTEMENMLSEITTSWNGLLVLCGDFNIDLLQPSLSITKQFMDLLYVFNLTQHINKATRTTRRSSTLIDLIISNCPQSIKYTDVLPCSIISDHDGPYALVDIRVQRFTPRFKYIRNEKHFDDKAFVEECSNLPFSVVFGIDDPNEKLEIFTNLLLQCLDKHAPRKRVKVTRPPAPWLMNDEIKKLQSQRDRLRHNAHALKSDNAWDKFRKIRNLLKKKIREAHKQFINKALSSKKSKKVWQVIYRILRPSPTPLRCDVDALNEFFTNTASRITGDSTTDSKQDLMDYINNISTNHDQHFNLRNVTYAEVLKELKLLRSDTSTGPDHLPAKFLKLVAEHIASPLTDIINSFIKTSDFPSAWKQARVTPIPKVDSPQENSDFRPISILPVLSKVYERLVHNQIVEHVENNHLLADKMSGFRKGHSTQTVLIGMRDDILRSMKRGEVSMMLLADFSKAFDTVKYKSVLTKLNALGFSKSFLEWSVNYLTGRVQFVQIDDRQSKSSEVNFGVPQGSIMGPLLFNLYVSDLSEILDSNCYQYADDTTIIQHSKPENLSTSADQMNSTIEKLQDYVEDSNLVLNPQKTKYALFSTKRLATVRKLGDVDLSIKIDEKPIERVSKTKLLGSYLHEHLTWEENVKEVAASCYRTLATLRKLKNVLPMNIRKTLVQTLVLSKLYYNSNVYHNLPEYLIKRLERVQKACAGFVFNRYANTKDVINLNWLPIKDHFEWVLLKTTHKAMYSNSWPQYLKLEKVNHSRNLRSRTAVQLSIPLIKHTFQDQAASVFNNLPPNIRNCTIPSQFNNLTFKFLMNRVNI